jgi:nicotinamide/nicotinate riboside kinase
MGLSIGVGGVSRAGKTTFSNYMTSLYKGKKSLVISMDDYVHEKEKIPMIKDRIDWETPASVDYDRLKTKIEDSVKEYDLVITEGILIFYSEEVNKLFDKRVFLDIPKSLFYQRRHSDKRWGEEPKWYLDYVWESYLKYGKLNETFSDTLYISGNDEFSALTIDEYLFKVG